MEWLELATETINTGIAVTKELEDRWLERIRNSPAFCSICHCRDYTRVIESKLENGELYKYTCNTCGMTWYRKGESGPRE